MLLLRRGAKLVIVHAVMWITLIHNVHRRFNINVYLVKTGDVGHMKVI